MKKKKIPLRMCIITKQLLPKSELLRIVNTSSNEIVLDFSGKLNGRGAYITNNLEVMQKLVKTKALNRAFKKDIPNNTYNEVMEQYVANNKQ